VLDLYRRYLEARGYAMIGLSNANDLNQYVRQFRPMAVLLDISMPGKDGWEAIADLKQDTETRSYPVILCSIHDERQRGYNVGAAAYLVKPIVEEDLLKALDNIASSSAGEVRTVVIADADQVYARRIAGALESAGNYNVRVVHAGYEVLQAIQEHIADAIVLDLDLPDMDGYGLLVTMRSHSDTRSIPVVVLSERPLSVAELEKVNPSVTQYLNKSDYQSARLLQNLSAVLHHT